MNDGLAKSANAATFSRLTSGRLEAGHYIYRGHVYELWRALVIALFFNVQSTSAEKRIEDDALNGHDEEYVQFCSLIPFLEGAQLHADFVVSI